VLKQSEVRRQRSDVRCQRSEARAEKNDEAPAFVRRLPDYSESFRE